MEESPKALFLEEKLAESFDWLFSQEEERLRIELFQQALPLIQKKDLCHKQLSEKILKEQLLAQISSVRAKVIARDPQLWSHLIWINIGSNINKTLGYTYLKEDCPVLAHGAIIGVIEKIQENKSCVRLITDPSMTPSVRVARGSLATLKLIEDLRLAIAKLELIWPENSSVLEGHIHEAITSYTQKWDLKLLAKGRLCGKGDPLWRSRYPILKGIGFNYDFADELGPALELRTGRPLHAFWTEVDCAMVQSGDMLITTGMDGLFPSGLLAGYVLKVHPLEEGAFSYDLDVLAACGHLDTLSEVEVLGNWQIKQ